VVAPLQGPRHAGDVPHEDPILAALCAGKEPWHQAALIAGRQGRAIKTTQLRACGISSQSILTATRRHVLPHVHRGVRAFGTRQLDRHGEYWAAHLAAGADSALCDLAGAAHMGLHAWSGTIHLAAPTNRRNHRGVEVHRLESLTPAMIVVKQGLPVLKPPHLLLELGARLSADRLAIALNEALARRLVRIGDLEAVLDLRGGHHGAGALAGAVGAALDDPGTGRTHGELEQLVLVKLRAVPALPPYERNAPVVLGAGRRANADLLFPGLGVLVELDSRTWHEQRLAMDSDRRRDQRALAAGYITFRVTWHHATREWDDVVADLLATLEGRSQSAGIARAS
jgi:hypothetical protein